MRKTRAEFLEFRIEEDDVNDCTVSAPLGNARRNTISNVRSDVLNDVKINVWGRLGVNLNRFSRFRLYPTDKQLSDAYKILLDNVK